MAVRVKVGLEEVMIPGVVVTTMTVLVVGGDLRKGLELHEFLCCHGKGSQ